MFRTGSKKLYRSVMSTGDGTLGALREVRLWALFHSWALIDSKTGD